MRRMLFALAAAALTTAITFVPTGTAQAATSLGCRIYPGPTSSLNQFCHTDQPAGWYNLIYMTSGWPAGSTYSWTWNGANSSTTVIGGCTWALAFCNLRPPGVGGDQFITATVTVYSAEGAVIHSSWSEALIPAICWYGRYELC